MVHVFCLNENCRKIIHVDSQEKWNFKGKLRCVKCGAVMEVEIVNGKMKSSKKSEGR